MKFSQLLVSLALFHVVPLASAVPITYVDAAADFVITTDNGTAGVLDAGDLVTWQPTTEKEVTGLVFGTTAFTSIQAAVNGVHGGGPYTVNIAPGTYTEGAEITINKNNRIILQGDSAETTILSGANTHRVISVPNDPVSTIFINDLSITNGYSATEGGGIYNKGANLWLNNTIVSGNTAFRGGGIFHDRTDVDVEPFPLELNNTTVSGNSATEGGGVFLNGVGSGYQYDLRVNNSSISGNLAQTGGGIYNDDHLAFIRDSIISENSVTAGDNRTCTDESDTRDRTNQGGGIYQYGDAGGTRLDNTIISGNSARYGAGAYTEGPLYFNNSTISENSSTFDAGFSRGAGIYISNRIEFLPESLVYNYGTAEINNTTISGNSLGMGGGGGIFVDYECYLAVNNSTISGNAGGTGAGISNRGDAFVNGCTITGNSANSGGGILNTDTGNLTVNNTIVAGNTDVMGPASPDIVANEFIAQGINFIGDLAGATPSGAGTNLTFASTSTTIADLLDTTLADNGGPTRTHALVVGSPALDAGDNETAGIYYYPGVELWSESGWGWNVFTTDQRGESRIFGGSIDIGAFESLQNTSLLDWRTLHGLEENGDDDLGNPSGDGVPSLLKYAFNMAPNVGDLQESNNEVMAPDGDSGFPLFERTEEGLLSITFVRRKASSFSGVSYQPYSGEDLTNFNPLSMATATVTSIDDEWERVTVVDPVASDKRFAYISVTER